MPTITRPINTAANTNVSLSLNRHNNARYSRGFRVLSRLKQAFVNLGSKQSTIICTQSLPLSTVATTKLAPTITVSGMIRDFSGLFWRSLIAGLGAAMALATMTLLLANHAHAHQTAVKTAVVSIALPLNKQGICIDGNPQTMPTLYTTNISPDARANVRAESRPLRGASVSVYLDETALTLHYRLLFEAVAVEASAGWVQLPKLAGVHVTAARLVTQTGATNLFLDGATPIVNSTVGGYLLIGSVPPNSMVVIDLSLRVDRNPGDIKLNSLNEILIPLGAQLLAQDRLEFDCTTRSLHETMPYDKHNRWLIDSELFDDIEDLFGSCGITRPIDITIEIDSSTMPKRIRSATIHLAEMRDMIDDVWTDEIGKELVDLSVGRKSFHYIGSLDNLAQQFVLRIDTREPKSKYAQTLK